MGERYMRSNENSPEQINKNARRSLRPLPQPPGSSVSSDYKPLHSRSQTIGISSDYNYDGSPYDSHSYLPQNDEILSATDSRMDSLTPAAPHRVHAHHTHTNSHGATLTAPELQQLQTSSTSHLRTLSKFARSTDSEDFSITSSIPSVVGLQGRRQL